MRQTKINYSNLKLNLNQNIIYKAQYMRLIFNDDNYMVFNISYNKLEVYDKHMGTQAILSGDKAKKCNFIVENFNSNKNLSLDEVDDILDEMIQDIARPFDVH